MSISKINKINMIQAAAIALIAAGSITEAAHAASQDEICRFEPAIVELPAGSSTKISLRVGDGGHRDYINLTMGDLPIGVEGGFLEDGNGADDRFDILLKAGPGAQTGSLMIPVIARLNGQKEAVCQFNLVLADTKMRSATTASALGAKRSVTSGSLFTLAWNLVSRLFNR